jgi:hypothetical protein
MNPVNSNTKYQIRLMRPEDNTGHGSCNRFMKMEL